MQRTPKPGAGDLVTPDTATGSTVARRSTVLAIVAPGQGAQTPGFLQPWLELPTFGALLDQLSTVCGLDLLAYGTKADADAIRDTAVAQPLLVAAGLGPPLTRGAIRSEYAFRPITSTPSEPITRGTASDAGLPP